VSRSLVLQHCVQHSSSPNISGSEAKVTSKARIYNRTVPVASKKLVDMTEPGEIVPTAPHGVPPSYRTCDQLQRCRSWGLKLLGKDKEVVRRDYEGARALVAVAHLVSNVTVIQIKLGKSGGVRRCTTIGVHDYIATGQSLKFGGFDSRSDDMPRASSRLPWKGTPVVACLCRGPKWRARSSCSSIVMAWFSKTGRKCRRAAVYNWFVGTVAHPQQIAQQPGELC
jgi:hypothetical protein